MATFMLASIILLHIVWFEIGIALEVSSQKVAILLVIDGDNASEKEKINPVLNCTIDFVNKRMAFQNDWSLVGNTLLVNNDDQSGSQLYENSKRFHKDGSFIAVIGPSVYRNAEIFYPHIAGIEIPQFAPISLHPALFDKNRFPWLLQMTSSYEAQIKAILDLVLAMGWSKIHICVADEEYYRDIAQNFMLNFDKVIDMTVNVIHESKSGTADVESSMRTLKESGQRIAVLLCGSNLIRLLLLAAEKHEMTSSGWAWILWDDVMNQIQVKPSLSDKTDCLLSYPGLLAIRMRIDFDEEFQKHIQACSKISLHDVSIVTSKYVESILALGLGLYSLLRSTNETVTLPTTNNTSWRFGRSLFDHIQFHLKNTSQSSRSYGNTFLNSSFATSSKLEILNLHNKQWVTVGEWDALKKLKMNQRNITLMGRTSNISDYDVNSRYRRLKVLTFASPPFVFINNDSATNENYSGFGGYGFDLLRALQQELGFSFVVEVSHTEVFGTHDPFSGRWSGLIGELVAGRADIAVAPLAITVERAHAVVFGPPLFETSLKYIIDTTASRGVLSGYDRFAFLLPFTETLWGVIVATAVFIACYLTIVSRLSPYGARGSYFQSEEAEVANLRLERRRSSVASRRISNVGLLGKRRSSSVFPESSSSLYIDAVDSRRKIFPPTKTTEKDQDSDEDMDMMDDNRNRAQRQMSFSNSLYFAFAALLWQSPESVPRAPSARVAAAIWYMVGVIVVASYTANMVAFVTLSTASSHTHHVQDLLKQSVIIPGTISNSLVNTFLMSSSLPIAEKLYEAILKNPTKALPPNMEVALQKVAKGELAFIWDGAVLDYIADQSPECRLQTVPLTFGKFSHSFAFRHDFSFYGTTEEASYTALTYASLAGVFDMLLVAGGVSLLILLVEWLVAALLDVDYTDPKRPASLGRALQIRRKRLVEDANENWIPFKKARKNLWQKISYRSNKTAQNKMQKVKSISIQPNQWKRYTSSKQAANLRPGQSVSEPDLIRLEQATSPYSSVLW